MAAPGTTRQSAARFIRDIRRPGGRPLARQELDGELLTDRAGAMWTRALIDASAKTAPSSPMCGWWWRLTTGLGQGDACGIVVAALGEDGIGRICATPFQTSPNAGPRHHRRRPAMANRPTG